MITIILLILALNFLIILNYEKFVKFINIYDLPNTKIKRHKKKVPIAGGIILFINIFGYLFYQLFFFEKFFIYSIDQFQLREIISIIFFLFSIFILGLYDDKYRLMPNTKLIWFSSIHCENLTLEKKETIRDNIYKISKKISEDSILEIQNWEKYITIIRLGNVIGSPGRFFNGNSNLFPLYITKKLLKQN